MPWKKGGHKFRKSVLKVLIVQNNTNPAKCDKYFDMYKCPCLDPTHNLLLDTTYKHSLCLYSIWLHKWKNVHTQGSDNDSTSDKAISPCIVVCVCVCACVCVCVYI